MTGFQEQSWPREEYISGSNGHGPAHFSQREHPQESQAKSGYCGKVLGGLRILLHSGTLEGGAKHNVL